MKNIDFYLHKHTLLWKDVPVVIIIFFTVRVDFISRMVLIVQADANWSRRRYKTNLCNVWPFLQFNFDLARVSTKLSGVEISRFRTHNSNNWHVNRLRLLLDFRNIFYHFNVKLALLNCYAHTNIQPKKLQRLC